MQKHQNKLQTMNFPPTHSHYEQQRQDATTKWSFDDTSVPLYVDDNGSEELAVGGVYLRLFIQNSGWVVQRPKEFMVELFDKWVLTVANSSTNGDTLEMVSRSLICLLQQQASLLDQVPQLGHIPHLVTALASPQASVCNTSLKIVSQLADSEVFFLLSIILCLMIRRKVVFYSYKFSFFLLKLSSY